MPSPADENRTCALSVVAGGALIGASLAGVLVGESGSVGLALSVVGAIAGFSYYRCRTK